MSKQATRRPKRLPDDLTDVRLDDLIRLIVRTQQRMRAEAGAELHFHIQVVPANRAAEPQDGGRHE